MLAFKGRPESERAFLHVLFSIGLDPRVFIPSSPWLVPCTKESDPTRPGWRVHEPSFLPFETWIHLSKFPRRTADSFRRGRRHVSLSWRMASTTIFLAMKKRPFSRMRVFSLPKKAHRRSCLPCRPMSLEMWRFHVHRHVEAMPGETKRPTRACKDEQVHLSW